MLVLSRRKGERIHIGDDVVITIVSIEHNRVQIGIDAPREVPVRRSELEKVANDEPKCHDSIA